VINNLKFSELTLLIIETEFIPSYSLFPCTESGPILMSLRAGCKINVISNEFTARLYCNITHRVILQNYYVKTMVSGSDVVLKTGLGLKISLKTISLRSWSWPKRSWS